MAAAFVRDYALFCYVFFVPIPILTLIHLPHFHTISLNMILRSFRGLELFYLEMFMEHGIEQRRKM